MISKGPKTVVMVSYESGDFSSCPAEWADDKVDAMLKLGYSVVLVTSLASRVVARDSLKIVRVPSLSWFDYRDETRRRSTSSWRPKLGLRVFGLISLTFGLVFDGIFRLLAGNLSWGRYSWVMTATPVIAWQLLLHKNPLLFATGGPSSAQLSAVVAGSLFSKRPFLEFQDPLVGTQMSMSPLAWKVLRALERFLVRGSQRTYFVTKGAAEDAKHRNSDLAQSISFLYPGAKYFDLPSIESTQTSSPHFELVHMGSLYGSRNLDNLFMALDRLYDKVSDLRGKVRVKNIGNLSVSNRNDYLKRPDFEQVEPMSRESAIGVAAQSNVLLLVQHTDDRSETTIPYKTYDYLNLGMPILGLLRNPELEQLILNQGGVCASNADPSDIERAVREILDSPFFEQGSSRSSQRGIDITDQVNLLLGGAND